MLFEVSMQDDTYKEILLLSGHFGWKLSQTLGFGL